MNQTVKDDAIALIINARELIAANDFYHLRIVSNRVIHNASIFQDKYSISIAVAIYAISKLSDRITQVKPRLLKHLKDIQVKIEHDNEAGVEAEFKTLFDTIRKVDHEVGKYVMHVINRAEVNKGEKIYDHGISLGQVAQILNISQWELMSHVGHTNLCNSFECHVKVKDRLKFTRRLFNQ